MSCSASAWKRYQGAGCKLAAIGMVNVLGASTETIFQRALAGDTSRFSEDHALVPNQQVLVGRVQEPLAEMPSRLARFDFRNCQLILTAFQQIEKRVAAAVEQYGAERVAVIMGSSTAGIAVNEASIADGATDQSHLFQEMISVAQCIAEYAGLRGPFYTISTACSSSAKVFAVAQRMMDQGIVDAVVVGGADTLSKLTVNGFSSLGLLSEKASNPFSRNRSGIIIGEGAATVLLTKEGGGTQLLGVGESVDAYHFSAPDPEGIGAEQAMRTALTQAGVEPADVFYLNAHGTGTPPNDKMEAEAISRVFSQSPYCSSTKPLTGHLLGASGVTEIALSACCLEPSCVGQSEADCVLPPHHWDGEVDLELPSLALVAQGEVLPRPELAICISNSFAFGGSNASVVFAAAI